MYMSQDECPRRLGADGSFALVSDEAGLAKFRLVAMDYFGPIPVRKDRKVEKSCRCLFTYLKTCAVCMDFALKLDTDSLIMEMERLVGRRMASREICSVKQLCRVCFRDELQRNQHQPREN